MQIKVTRIEDGPAKVEVINPTSGECLSATEVNVGQEVVVSLPNAHAVEDVQVGEVVGSAEAETTEEPGEAEGGEPGGETQEPGGGEGEATGGEASE